jgi:hypothetical protein
LILRKGDKFKCKFSEVPQEFLQKNPMGGSFGQVQAYLPTGKFKKF